jgi:hypothetical protein
VDTKDAGDQWLSGHDIERGPQCPRARARRQCRDDACCAYGTRDTHHDCAARDRIRDLQAGRFRSVRVSSLVVRCSGDIAPWPSMRCGCAVSPSTGPMCRTGRGPPARGTQAYCVVRERMIHMGFPAVRMDIAVERRTLPVLRHQLARPGGLADRAARLELSVRVLMRDDTRPATQTLSRAWSRDGSTHAIPRGCRSTPGRSAP